MTKPLKDMTNEELEKEFDLIASELRNRDYWVEMTDPETRRMNTEAYLQAFGGKRNPNIYAGGLK